MSQKEKYKICLVGECLATGGAEKAMALLSQFFASKGIDVHTVIVVDQITYDYSGTLLNLGKFKNASNGIANKIKRFQTLKHYLNKNSFDYIIDFRIRKSFLQEFLISRLLYTTPTVYTVHSAMTDLYLPKSKWQSKIIYKKAFGIVAVSKKITEIISRSHDLNAKTIHNPIAIEAIQRLSELPITEKPNYILAAGRMDANVKQFDQLILAYSKSNLPKENIRLLILGDGKLKESYEKLIQSLDLEALITCKGMVENPYAYMKNALFFVLSSKREGLPTVILESLASGTPVVSFDCVSGPAEMIQNAENGILVEDQNFEKLTESLNVFFQDNTLYNHCKSNAKASVASFSLENIGGQWLDFLKINVS